MKFLKKILAAFAVISLAFGHLANAADYPERPIRWIVPFPAGGGTDVVARAVADAMQPSLGQTLFVDNRPGGASAVAVGALLQAKPDGYTVLHGENSALIWNEHLYKKLPYSPEKDFTYVGAIGRFPVALVVNPDFPARNLKEFVEIIRKNPGKYTFASPGNGTPHHLAMELFKQRSSLFMVHVPYKGGALAMQDVMAGHVPIMMLDLASGLQTMRAGKVRVLAVAMPQRAKALPEIPTFAEAGVPGVDAYALFGLVGPAGMPVDVVNRLNAALNKALESPKVLTLFNDTGGEATPGSADTFHKTARSESARWGKVIKAANITLE